MKTLTNIELHVQLDSGYWQYVKTIQQVDDRYLLNEMKQVQSNWSGKRVKATQDGKLVDILQ